VKLKLNFIYQIEQPIEDAAKIQEEPVEGGSWF